MSKIRVIDDMPVMDDSGNVIHAQVLAGPSDDREAMDTGHLANGTLFLESDTGKLYALDEDSGWKERGPKLQAKTVTPTTSQQTVSPDSGHDGLSSVTVNAVPSGSATTPATTITANPSISVSSGGLITASVSESQSVTPTVSEGYVSSGTAGTVSVSGSDTSQLDTQAAQTIHPSATDQSIASGKYLTGAQTVKGVLLTNLSADNIKKDVVVKVGDSTDDDCVASVTGTYEGGGGTAKTVTITLDNPEHPDEFGSFTIYEETDGVKGSLIGSIPSPTGSATVTVSASANGLRCELSGSYVFINDSYITYSVSIGNIGVRGSDGSSYISYVVAGDGAIQLDRIDWDD